MEEKGSLISELIVKLEKLIEKKCWIVEVVRYPEMLISALKELDNMVEMTSVKVSIVKQVHFLIFKTFHTKKKGSKFENHMLNTVIFGPPGVGKTKVGIILGKIWISLGLIHYSKEEEKDNSQNSIPDKIKEVLYYHHLLELKSDLVQSQNKLKRIHSTIDQSVSGVKQMRRKMVEMKDLILPNPSTSSNRSSEDNYHFNPFEDDKAALDHKWNSLFDDMNKLRIRLNSINQPDSTNVENFSGKDKIPILTSLELVNRHNSNTVDPKSSLTLINSGNLLTSDNKNVDPKNSLTLINSNNLLTSDNKNIDPNKSNESNDSKNNDSKNDENNVENLPIKIVGRSDFVGEFVGHTEPKTLKLLNDNIGKVLFIDEAYSLVNGERDSFGFEAINALNKFMSEHPNDIVIIFAGYKELMQETIFLSQPGLRRRCTWVFEVEGYSSRGLSEIFNQQLKETGWILDPSVDPVFFFEQNKNLFPSFGGDTNKLALHCKLLHASYQFDQVYQEIIKNDFKETDKIIDNNVISKDILKEALIDLSKNDTNSRKLPESLIYNYI